jgi:hypothetical protein
MLYAAVRRMIEDRRVQVPKVRALRGVTGDEEVPGVFAGCLGPR